jgi:hypothetical protein
VKIAFIDWSDNEHNLNYPYTAPDDCAGVPDPVAGDAGM